MVKKKEKYKAIASSNGKTCRYYLKPIQIEFINQQSVNLDKSPSEFLREVLDGYQKILFLIKKQDGDARCKIGKEKNI
ncbi:hypothetical protein K8R47_02780 [archaeon]|nr:hypothetical protein [archaeon]